jgi:hypothetical protein
VDQAVLNRARAAVEPHEGSKRPWSFGWLHALTTAAVIVLAVTLIIPQRESGPPTGQDLEDQQRLEEDVDAPGANQADESRELRRLRSAPPAAPASEAQTEAAGLADSADTVMEAEESAPVRSEFLQAERKSENTEASQPETGDAVASTDAQSRLQSIRSLLAAGEREAAREAALAFQRDFPDIELPEDLAPLLSPAPGDPDP